MYEYRNGVKRYEGGYREISKTVYVREGEKEKAFYTKGMEKENDMKVVFTMDYVMEEDRILIVWN